MNGRQSKREHLEAFENRIAELEQKVSWFMDSMAQQQAEHAHPKPGKPATQRRHHGPTHHGRPPVQLGCDCSRASSGVNWGSV